MILSTPFLPSTSSLFPGPTSTQVHVFPITAAYIWILYMSSPPESSSYLPPNFFLSLLISCLVLINPLSPVNVEHLCMNVGPYQ